MTKAEARSNIEEERARKRRVLLTLNNEWYSIRSLMGYANKAIFYILLGGRDYGKSYAIMKKFLVDWKTKGIPFFWLRLNERSAQKLLCNNAEKLIDPDLRRSFGIKTMTKGNDVFDVTDGPKKARKMATVIALSTFYNDKGVALFDNEFLKNMANHFNICCDEFQPEKDQRRQGDVAYQFVNQLENVVRDSKDRMRIFLCANCLEEASDILCLFHFIPEEFGRYWIPSCRAVIDYMQPSEKYMARRRGTVADLLMPKASTFTNKIEIDTTLVTGNKRLIHPTGIIQFRKECKFTIWDGNVIAEWNGEKCNSVIAMRPYQDVVFNAQLRDKIIEMFDTRCFLYKHTITMKKFQSQIQLLKPRGN